MDIKYNIRTFIKANRQIMCRVRWNNGSNEIGFFIGYYGDPNKWDSANQCPIRGTTHEHDIKKVSASTINRAISEYKAAIEDCFKFYEGQSYVPQKEELKLLVNDKLGKIKPQHKESKNKDFFQLMDNYVTTTKSIKGWTEAVTKKFASLKTLLLEFDKKLSFDTLDLSKMLELRNWFIRHEYRNRTTNKYFGFLFWFLRWADKEGYLTHQDILKFKTNLKVIAKPVSYLTMEELLSFYRFQFPIAKQYLDRARDVFCFMAFTSLRISDLKALCWHNIKNDIIEIVTEKTDDRLLINLNEYAKELLAKYQGLHLPNNKVFPAASNQKLNDYLKEAAQLAGLNKVWLDEYYIGTTKKEETYKFHEIISCHDARRTFICCSLAMGISPEVVMKWTGHSDYSSMKPYIEVADETKAESMDKWNTDGKTNTVEAEQKALKVLKELGLGKEEILTLINKL